MAGGRLDVFCIAEATGMSVIWSVSSQTSSHKSQEAKIVSSSCTRKNWIRTKTFRSLIKLRLIFYRKVKRLTTAYFVFRLP